MVAQKPIRPPNHDAQGGSPLIARVRDHLGEIPARQVLAPFIKQNMHAAAGQRVIKEARLAPLTLAPLKALWCLDNGQGGASDPKPSG